MKIRPYFQGAALNVGGESAPCPARKETSDEDGEPSFDLVPGKEEVADTGGEPQATSFHPKYLRQPSNHQSKKGSFTT